MARRHGAAVCASVRPVGLRTRFSRSICSLATGLLAAVEGGYLLSQTGRDPRLMQAALDMAIGHVASFAVAAEAAP